MSEILNNKKNKNKNKAYKFRIYPTKEQEVLLSKTFGCCRFIYNVMLSDKMEMM